MSSMKGCLTSVNLSETKLTKNRGNSISWEIFLGPITMTSALILPVSFSLNLSISFSLCSPGVLLALHLLSRSLASFNSPGISHCCHDEQLARKPELLALVDFYLSLKFLELLCLQSFLISPLSWFLFPIWVNLMKMVHNLKSYNNSW